MKLICLVMLMVGVAAMGQDFPQAPKPKIDGANKWMVISSLALRGFDVGQTCYHFTEGAREVHHWYVGTPGQGCLTNASFSFGVEALGIGISKMFHHFHHDRWAMVPNAYNAAVATNGIAYSYTHQNIPQCVSVPGAPKLCTVNGH